jgi:3-hydroxy-9,10-secoandrosta-1,3,5(10)-triene-9,17-dione monooxygenase
MGVIGVHDWMVGRFPEQAQREVWGDARDAQISSALAGTGQVERTPGGFRISGRFPYSSGSHHCTWVVLGGAVRDPDRILTLAFLLPRTDYVIDDVWHVAGLAGTGATTSW